jgi:hypothetical protein
MYFRSKEIFEDIAADWLRETVTLPIFCER